jgi:hypothetical protein
MKVMDDELFLLLVSCSLSLQQTCRKLPGLMNLLQGSDMPVTTQPAKAIAETELSYDQLYLNYSHLTGGRLTWLNGQPGKTKLEKISL